MPEPNWVNRTLWTGDNLDVTCNSEKHTRTQEEFLALLRIEGLRQ